MRQRTDLEQDKASMLKAYRAAIRLKHSLAADAEINERLPALEAKLDAALAAGQPLVLEIGEIHREV